MKSQDENDWVTGSISFLVAWGIPISAILITGYGIPSAIPFIWPVAFGWMGCACFLNARRCSRVHCYFTGWFFIVVAVVAASFAKGWITLGGFGWEALGFAALEGGTLLWCGTEIIFGRYFERKRRI